jgi:hypothetical protein
MIEILKENLKANKQDFLNKLGSYEGWEVPWAWPKHPSRPNGGYPSNSVFFSEAFALYSLSQYYNIDILIESGVYRGGSTSVWGRTLSNLKIFSVDYVKEGANPRQKWDGVRSTLGPLYPNITFIEGNGNKLLPEIIENNPSKKIGVFVDGPKDTEGLNLAKKCLSYDNVYFSSLHDYVSKDYFHTRLSEFREIASDLDVNHPQILKYPKGAGLTILKK